MRLRYEANRADEIQHLTASQPTARKAVRLQALLPTKEQRKGHPDKLSKTEVWGGGACVSCMQTHTHAHIHAHMY